MRVTNRPSCPLSFLTGHKEQKMAIITAIYDKKAKAIGKIIVQRTVEEAITGVKDALNSLTINGEYLMPAHRERPEDYCLIQLGWLDETAKEKTEFKEENGEIKAVTKKSDEPYIKVQERTLIEFTDIELQEKNPHMSNETVVNLVNKKFEELSQNIKEVLKNDQRNNLAPSVHSDGSNTRSRWHILRNMMYGK